MNSNWVTDVCRHFGLGQLLTTAEEVSGGLLHQVWRIKTTAGEFAIKRIHPENSALFRHNLLSPQLSQQVASLMKQRGVSTVVALEQAGCVTYEKEGLYLVMPWVRGSLLQANDYDTNSCEKIGEQLALIQVSERIFPTDLPKWAGLEKDCWRNLIANICDEQLRESMLLEITQLTEWSFLAQAAQAYLLGDLVISHRDLDNKNVLWRNGEPIILDWEYAGYIHPLLDLFIVAINWSLVSGIVQKELFQQVIKGFVKNVALSNSLTVTRNHLVNFILPGYYGYCLDWIIALLSKEKINDVMKSQIIWSLEIVKHVAQSQDDIITWLLLVYPRRGMR